MESIIPPCIGTQDYTLISRKRRENKSRNLSLHLNYRTAFIRIKQDEKWHKVKALINPTQKITTVSSELVRRLRMPTTYLNKYRICNLKIGSVTDKQLRLEAHALIPKDLPTRPYKQDISDEIRKRFCHLVLADPSFNRKDHVMIKLGSDIYPQIIKSGIYFTPTMAQLSPKTLHLDGL